MFLLGTNDERDFTRRLRPDKRQAARQLLQLLPALKEQLKRGGNAPLLIVTFGPRSRLQDKLTLNPREIKELQPTDAFLTRIVVTAGDNDHRSVYAVADKGSGLAESVTFEQADIAFVFVGHDGITITIAPSPAEYQSLALYPDSRLHFTLSKR